MMCCVCVSRECMSVYAVFVNEKLAALSFIRSIEIGKARANRSEKQSHTIITNTMHCEPTNSTSVTSNHTVSH